MCRSNSLDQKMERGTYVLIIHVPRERELKIGRLGSKRVPEGYYLYTGSAMGRGAQSLTGRISRHLSRDKRKRWHIDFLLGEEDVRVIDVLAIQSTTDGECKVNRYLKKRLEAEIKIFGFGSSDCRRGCGSHLLYLGEEEEKVEHAVKAVRELGGRRIEVKPYKKEI